MFLNLNEFGFLLFNRFFVTFFGIGHVDHRQLNVHLFGCSLFTGFFFHLHWYSEFSLSCRYNVKLPSPALSKEVRTKFGTFYVNGRDERPPEFKPYTVRNLLTQETRIRLAILQVIGRRYKDSNQGCQVKVIGYDPRPILRIIPPQDAQSRRVRTYTFVEAVSKYPTNFTKADLDFILSKVGYKQKGLLRALFICLSDDMLPGFKRGRDRADHDNPDVPMDDASNLPVVVSSDSSSETQTRAPAETSSGSRSSGSRSGHGAGSGSGHRTQKRGAGSPASAQPEKSSRV